MSARGQAGIRETILQGAAREVKEETNLDIEDMVVFGAADDIQPDRHFVTAHVLARKCGGRASGDGAGKTGCVAVVFPGGFVGKSLFPIEKVDRGVFQIWKWKIAQSCSMTNDKNTGAEAGSDAGIPNDGQHAGDQSYNMADTYFVSTLGTSASGAPGVVFGLMAIIQAFGFMFGHGAGSNISRQLGNRHVENARKFSSTSFFSVHRKRNFDPGAGAFVPDASSELLEAPIPSCPMQGSTAMDFDRRSGHGCRMGHEQYFAIRGHGCLCNGWPDLRGILNIFGDYLLIQVFDMGVMGAGISLRFPST